MNGLTDSLRQTFYRLIGDTDQEQPVLSLHEGRWRHKQLTKPRPRSGLVLQLQQIAVVNHSFERVLQKFLRIGVNEIPEVSHDVADECTCRTWAADGGTSS